MRDNKPLDQFTFDDPNKELFFAISFSDSPGVAGDFQKVIYGAVEKGADVNGLSEDGNTPLTDAILGGMGSPKAVKQLLELGADPSQRDANGWSPWGACLWRSEDRVVAKRMEKIKTLLQEFNSDQADEVYWQLEQAIKKNNLPKVQALLKQDIDVNVAFTSPLEVAVQNNKVEIAKLLLSHHANPNRESTYESCLILAAKNGNLEMVKLLVDSGAEVLQYAWGDEDCTAEFIAREEGHNEIADWLQQSVSPEELRRHEQKVKARNPKFLQIYEHRTNGINCDITTADVEKQLTRWDELYGVLISEVQADRLTIHFEKIPDNVSSLAKELYEFCPDIIDQGFGVMDEMVDMAQEGAFELDADVKKMIEGIDFEDENFGLVLLERHLKEHSFIELWWD